MFEKLKRDREVREKGPFNIFTVGIYHGSSMPPYLEKVEDLTIEAVMDLVRRRAQRDGQWCIDMDLVGDNEDKMRKMMEYVRDEDNIKRNVAYQINNETGATVDFVCRDLANGSKWVS
jgi:hypothetical protein